LREESASQHVPGFNPKTARFLIPTEISSNFGDGSPDSSFKGCGNQSPFRVNKLSLSPVSRRESRPLDEPIDPPAQPSDVQIKKQRLKEKIQGFQELFNRMDEKERESSSAVKMKSPNIDGKMKRIFSLYVPSVPSRGRYVKFTFQSGTLWL
jgi:hypothetical protein